MIILDLKEVSHLLDQYVALRNEHAEDLFTVEVNQEETLQWLYHANVVVLVACRDNEVVGASVLYLEKEGEIAVFVKEKRCGIATVLLKNIQDYAKEREMKKIWAWIADNNRPSSEFFQKNGFRAIQKSQKNFGATVQHGIIYGMEIA